MGGRKVDKLCSSSEIGSIERAGYSIHDRVLRATRVGVGSMVPVEDVAAVKEESQEPSGEELPVDKAKKQKEDDTESRAAVAAAPLFGIMAIMASPGLAEDKRRRDSEQDDAE